MEPDYVGLYPIFPTLGSVPLGQLLNFTVFAGKPIPKDREAV